MKKLIAYLSAFKWRMLGGFCIKVVGTVAELFLPVIMAYMIDDVAPTRSVLALSLWGVGMQPPARKLSKGVKRNDP